MQTHQSPLVISREDLSRKIIHTVWFTTFIVSLITAVLTYFVTISLPRSVSWVTIPLPIPQLDPQMEYNSQVEMAKLVMTEIYGVTDVRANEYAKLFASASNSKFPRLEDLLAVAAVESRFDENARSYADARGLMQVLHGDYRPELNIVEGSTILASYYKSLGGDRKAAFEAYNVGIGDYLRGVRNQDYVAAVDKELNKVKGMQGDWSVANL